MAGQNKQPDGEGTRLPVLRRSKGLDDELAELAIPCDRGGMASDEEWGPWARSSCRRLASENLVEVSKRARSRLADGRGESNKRSELPLLLREQGVGDQLTCFAVSGNRRRMASDEE